MKTIIVNLIICSALFVSCKDKPTLPAPQYPDIPDSVKARTIRGSVVYVDPYDSVRRPLADRALYINSIPGSTVSFADTIMTDKLGIFAAGLPDSTGSYTLTISSPITSAGTELFYYKQEAITPLTLQLENIVAEPLGTVPTLLRVTTLDMPGGRVPGATVLLYTSRILAEADSSGSGFGKLDQKITNSKGEAVFNDVTKDTIFIRAFLKINDSTVLKNGITAFQPAGIMNAVPVTLK